MRRARSRVLGYVAALALAFLLALVGGWLGAQIDNYAYDWMFRRNPPPPRDPESALLVVDEHTLSRMGGIRRLREILAAGLERLATARPRAVALDVTLPDEAEPAADARLEAALARLPNLVLPCELVDGGRRWEDPHPRFRRHAAALGHVHADPDPLDNVTRRIPLAKASGHDRRWALALEVFRLARGGPAVLETPAELEVGGLTIPTGRDPRRPLRIRYLPPGREGVSQIPRVSIAELAADPAKGGVFRDKAVFVGVIAQSAARDRLMTPFSYGRTMQGIEIHANAFETLAGGVFLRDAPEMAAAGFGLLLTILAGLAFWFRSGWQAYALGGMVIGLAHLAPQWLFARNVVLPYFGPVLAAWLSVGGAAAWQYFVVRRRWRQAEADKTRYQQAMHFVTHEMRTPLTAIQGSSELMARYNLSEEKRRQIAELIHSESRRMARMIETFLSVERLSAGQMELRREPFEADEVVQTCVARVRPLAERKNIRLHVERIEDGALLGDRELMEYAIYNLLTNAIKYSPPDTEVTVGGRREGSEVRIAVRDQGFGMDRDELRNLFRKFYRTRSAEASGEKGTGIGLSIVREIVSHHGGSIEVESEPGKGSCFTVVLPARAAARTGAE
ncbi:MAG: CHASE2 domain-containing protein [Bryobacterales bacterium]|nr:CHASE2 and HATPase_c domain-containing protein [Bryobacteraceae bacterium]MDW8131636.1 CHASE2 domain-containing protein [Bryobacterales bacterium]